MDPATLSALAALASAGPLAIAVVFGAAMLIFARQAYNREVKRGDAATAELAALTSALRDGLAANAKALDDLTTELRWSGRRTGRDSSAPH